MWTAESGDELRIGDCFNGPKEGRYEVVPCSSEHDAEVYWMDTLMCEETGSGAALAASLGVSEDSLTPETLDEMGVTVIAAWRLGSVPSYVCYVDYAGGG